MESLNKPASREWVEAHETFVPGADDPVLGPCGANGPESARGDRDAVTGRFTPGNRAALVVGEHSTSFWREHEQEYRERREAMLRDCGHTEADAPRALLDVVDGAVQGVLIPQ